MTQTSRLSQRRSSALASPSLPSSSLQHPASFCKCVCSFRACILAPRPRHCPRPPRMKRSPRHPLARPLACSAACHACALAPRPCSPRHPSRAPATRAPSPHALAMALAPLAWSAALATPSRGPSHAAQPSPRAPSPHALAPLHMQRSPRHMCALTLASLAPPRVRPLPSLVSFCRPLSSACRLRRRGFTQELIRWRGAAAARRAPRGGRGGPPARSRRSRRPRRRATVQISGRNAISAAASGGGAAAAAERKVGMDPAAQEPPRFNAR